jgi:uncharacterized membrane protein
MFPMRSAIGASGVLGGGQRTVLVALLFVVALAIRLYGLSIDPVWIDEAATLEIAALPFSDLFGEMARLESSPPGFYAVAKVWTRLWGTDVVSLRLLPAIAGALAVVPVWMFAREAFGDRAAWLSASMLAVAASHVRLSQDARTYTLLFLVFCCALTVALRLIRVRTFDRPAVLAMIVLGLLQGLLGWLHATSPILIASLACFVVAGAAAGTLGIVRGVIAAAVSGIITLVVAAPPFIETISQVIQPAFDDRWITPPSLTDALRVYGRTLVAPFLYELSIPVALVYAALLVFAVVMGIRRGVAAILGLAASLAFAACAMPAVSSVTPILLDRTVLFMAAPLILLVSSGAAALPPRLLLVAAILLLGTQTIGLVNYYRLDDRKEQWPAAAALMAGQLGPSQPVIVTEGAFAAKALSIPLKGGAETFRLIVVPPTSALERFVAQRSKYETVSAPADLCRAIAGVSSVWVVSRDLPAGVKRDEEFTTGAGVEAALRAAGSTVITQKNVTGIKVDRWSPPRCR